MIRRPPRSTPSNTLFPYRRSSDLDAIVEDAQNKAREESARIINEAKAEIESLKEAAISDIRKQVALLSVEVSEKVLKQKLSTDKAQMDYIDIMLDEVTSSNNK